MKRNFLFTRFLGCVMLASLFTSCNKDKDSSLGQEELKFGIGSVAHLPGFDDSDEAPQGTPFVLPKGLRFVERPNHRFDPDIRKLKGKMNTFYVDVHIVADSTWGGGELVIPKGLVMLNVAPSRIQNGMLMGRVRINVPPYSRNA